MGGDKSSPFENNLQASNSLKAGTKGQGKVEEISKETRKKKYEKIPERQFL